VTEAVDLFRILVGEAEWLLTSAEDEQTHDSELYLPASIGRGGIQQKSSLAKANLDVQLALDHELAQQLLSTWNEVPITLTLFSKRTSGTETIWKGRMTGTQPDKTFLKLVFESIYTSMRRPGLRARFQKSCRHALYGRGCTLDPADFATAATVDDITGVVLTIPEAALQADGYFTGGMVAAPDGTLSYIAQHAGSSITVNRVSLPLATAFAIEGAGMAVTIYPGCDHSYATCESKFSNDLNYGGFDYIPSKNPMGGSSIV
jgi:hypothetical protein